MKRLWRISLILNPVDPFQGRGHDYRACFRKLTCMDTFYTTGYLRLDIYYPFSWEEIHPSPYQSLNVPSYQAIICPLISGIFSALYFSMWTGLSLLYRYRYCPEINYASAVEAESQ